MVTTEATDISFPFAQSHADLIQISLLFCLRPCEYSKTNLHIQTVQFFLKDSQFHNAYWFIPHNAPYKTSLHDQSINLFLEMYKNSIWGESTTMEATNFAHGDPVFAVARRFFHLCSHHADLDTTISSCFSPRARFLKASPALTSYSSSTSMPTGQASNAWGSTFTRLAPARFARGVP